MPVNFSVSAGHGEDLLKLAGNTLITIYYGDIGGGEYMPSQG